MGVRLARDVRLAENGELYVKSLSDASRSSALLPSSISSVITVRSSLPPRTPSVKCARRTRQRMQPPSKRILRPTASQPTTAEHYGRQHGIPEDVQLALQNVGRKGRMAVSQGRMLDRTQSVPSTFLDPPYPPNGGFVTSSETMQHATRTIAREQSRELRPYHETTSSVDASYPTSSPPAVPLTFDLPLENLHSDSQQPLGGRGKRATRAGRKRKEEDGSETETSDIEADAEEDANPGLSWAISAETTQTTQGDFPPVFTSPQISQPELFAPPTPAFGRTVRNMPGRSLGKTVSAPVGMLGRYGRSRTGAEDGEMEVEVEDGFDVAEWAASEDF